MLVKPDDCIQVSQQEGSSGQPNGAPQKSAEVFAHIRGNFTAQSFAISSWLRAKHPASRITGKVPPKLNLYGNRVYQASETVPIRSPQYRPGI